MLLNNASKTLYVRLQPKKPGNDFIKENAECKESRNSCYRAERSFNQNKRTSNELHMTNIKKAYNRTASCANT